MKIHKLFTALLIFAVSLALLPGSVFATNSPQPLPYSQDWANIGLITVDDDWSGVPGVVGYRGDGLVSSTAVDPQTVVADGSATPLDVNANELTPNTFTTGGISEFEISDPVVALQGSGTADAPHIVLHLNTSGQSNITIAYNLRDIDGSGDNAVQPVALQYRVGASGNFTNLPVGFVADATTGPSLATLVTPVNVVLPVDADNQPEVQVRVITTDAVGSDEWVGIDDIVITGSPFQTATPTATLEASPTPTEEPSATPTAEVSPTPTEEASPTPTMDVSPTPTETATPLPSAAALVVNEVDYDQPSTDAAEFVEIRNNDSVSVDLSSYSLQFINGNGGAQYQLFPLPAVSLAPGDYFVLCGDSNNVPNCDMDVTPDTNLVQNGAPDAVALLFMGSLIDTVSYAGDTVAPYTEGSGVGLLDNPAITGAGISRCPDGTDTQQNNVDFSLRVSTPGAANACIPALVINEVDYDQPSTDTAEYIEIRNNDIFSVDLSSFSVEFINGSSGAVQYRLFALPAVSLAPGDYFVLCGNAANTVNCDMDVSPDTDLIQNGAPDALALLYNSAIIDVVSYEGNTTPPYTEGSGVGLVDDGASATQGISRCADGADTQQNNVDFSLRTNSPGEANNCVNDVPPTVSSTSPLNGATDASINTNIVINFSEDVTVSGSWFDISCSISGAHTAIVSGGLQSYTLNPDVDFTNGDVCTVTVFAADVVDLDGTPHNMAADYVFGFTAFDVCSQTFTPIYDIQGSGPSAAITGLVVTQGVVVGDYEGPSPTLRGFYIQDVTGDGSASTSDGIFVFNFDNNNVNLGDVVRVSGSAGEFQDQTQISSVTSIASCGTGSVTPVDVTLPVPSATFLEQYEGMLVHFPQTLYVTEHFQLGRFGQVVLSSDGRLQQPTNVVLPGAPALALQAANNLNRIILDDDLQNQNPDPILFGRGGNPLSASNTLRGGDTATGIVGIMTYTWSGNAASGNAYRLRPINALGGGLPDFQPANPRPTEAPDVGGTLTVVGMNLLNFFNTFDGLPDLVDNCTNGVGGAAADCRGADTQDEFDRQWPKTVAAILAMDADVIGVNEIENDGYGSDSALQFLVDRLNDATAPGTYAFIDVDAATGQVNAMGTDAIKVAMIYKPGSVTPVGQTAALNTVAFVNGGDSGPRSRPAIAQAFEENASGAVFIATANHLKSKGSACDDPDAGDGQGNCNIVRVNAAMELVSWLASDPTGTGDPDILLIGDYNSYAMEDPIMVFLNAGYTNLISDTLGLDAYSYVFDGQWGYLDHALASPSIVSQVSGVADYHINSDEPGVLDYNTDFKSPGQIISLYAPDEFRVSDHDSVIIGLNLDAPVEPSISFYFHAGAPRPNPVTLFLDNTAPTSAIIKSRDTAALKFAGGNPWKSVGTWTTAPALTVGTLEELSDLHVWLGVKHVNDQGANFDLRVNVYKNGVLVTSTEAHCITGLVQNPTLAQEVILSFGSFAPVTFNGTSDVMSVEVSARMGTDGSGNSCGGSSRATGLRFYFDSTGYPSNFDAIFVP